jgi:iron complex outermembrane receptor protein
VPYNSASFFSTFEVPKGNLKGLRLGLGEVIRDKQFGFSTASDGVTHDGIPGFGFMNAMLAYDWRLEHSTVGMQLNINNVLDKSYFSSVGYSSAYPGSPRAYSVALRYRFK